jgi:hypothetical protein
MHKLNGECSKHSRAGWLSSRALDTDVVALQLFRPRGFNPSAF